MANHRPKSLNELNQVYDKAMQAQRAIKEGSMSLSDEAPASEKPSQNIFDELKQQASQAKKPELYDSQIADIANDFLKRYAKPEQSKPQNAPKELKRPAPSIQSLYHTPVKTDEQESSDVPLKLEQTDFAAPVASTAPVTRPKAPESIEAPSPAVLQAEPETPTAAQEDLQPAGATTEQLRREATRQAQHEAYTAAKPEVTPSVRITSSERNDLINEYLRVMSDDDDSYFDDDEEYRKPKKGSFWSRMKKRRREAEPEETIQDNVSNEIEETESAIDVYSDYVEEEPVVPETRDSEEEAPLSLYDYIEADFDFGEEGEIAEETFVEVAEETVQEETPEAEPVQEEIFPTEPEEIVPSSETEKAPDEETQEIASAEEPEEEVIYPTEPEEISSAEEPEEEVIYPTEDEEETSPTAGMVFDDIFSVTDESKRSYTGGNWNSSFDVSPDGDIAQDEETPEQDESSYGFSDLYQEGYDNIEKIPAPKKKKGSVALKIVLSLALVILVACTGLVTVLGSVVAVDTGKLFMDKYRVFSAEQDFSLSGVNAGDLVITEDYNSYAAEGDSFVYVSHESHKFMIGKHSGSTYSLTGDVLFIAENEAGRVLVLREDTLGAITKTYKGLGTILAPVSDNYILIDAVLLVLMLAVFLCLIIPAVKKSGKDDDASPEALYPAETQDPEEYTEEEDTDGEQPKEDDSEEFDAYDYDTDDIEEGLFSGI